MRIVAIAVVASNGVIGDGTDQPFKIKADWARFKRTTMGHCMVMGRKTFQAMGVLGGRTSIVVTRHPASVEEHPQVRVAGSVDEAFEIARGLGEDTCYVTGGGEIYRSALPSCDEVDLTEVAVPADGSVTFPELGPGWREVAREEHAEHDPPFAFVRYDRA